MQTALEFGQRPRKLPGTLLKPGMRIRRFGTEVTVEEVTHRSMSSITVRLSDGLSVMFWSRQTVEVLA